MKLFVEKERKKENFAVKNFILNTEKVNNYVVYAKKTLEIKKAFFYYKNEKSLKKKYTLLGSDWVRNALSFLYFLPVDLETFLRKGQKGAFVLN